MTSCLKLASKNTLASLLRSIALLRKCQTKRETFRKVHYHKIWPNRSIGMFYYSSSGSMAYRAVFKSCYQSHIFRHGTFNVEVLPGSIYPGSALLCCAELQSHRSLKSLYHSIKTCVLDAISTVKRFAERKPQSLVTKTGA